MGASMKDPIRLLPGSNPVTGRMDRREFISRCSIAAATLPIQSRMLINEAFAESKTVTYASLGGSYNDMLSQAFMKGFEANTGIKVDMGANASLALTKLQAETSPAQWDIIEITGSEYEIAVRQNLLLPYDYSVIDTSHVPSEYKRPYGIKFVLFAFVMAWDQRKIPDDKAPKTWADFWDTSKYPGKRSISANIQDGSVLEAAVLADGGKIEALYPLDVDRAFKSLDRLGKNNIIWHTTNAEPIQQLTSGEVALATSFNNRVVAAKRSGGQIGTTSNYSAVNGDYLAVVKTSKNAQNAFKLVSYMVSDTNADVEFTKLTSLTISNTDALKQLPKDLADTLPTNPDLKGVFIKDDAWWADNLENTFVRFKQWQVG
jgi:putative spermidine/putrescine transport system substrate-binding protein